MVSNFAFQYFQLRVKQQPRFKFFSTKCGVRQGCPLSGLLFDIGLELLARAIKRDALIKGIVIGEEEIKTSMYADNTTVFVQDTDSILQLLNMLE